MWPGLGLLRHLGAGGDGSDSNLDDSKETRTEHCPAGAHLVRVEVLHREPLGVGHLHGERQRDGTQQPGVLWGVKAGLTTFLAAMQVESVGMKEGCSGLGSKAPTLYWNFRDGP